MLALTLMGVFGFFYFRHPKTASVSSGKRIAVNAKAFSREFFRTEDWAKWWPKNGEVISPRHYRYNDVDYIVSETRYSSLLITVQTEKDSLPTELVIVPLQTDSVSLSWTGRLPSSPSFFSRPATFSRIKRINHDLQDLLTAADRFYSKEDNLYNPPVRKELVVDSLLISTAVEIGTLPSTQLVYDLLDKLTIYAQSRGAKQTGYPMLNVTTQNGGASYLVRVALPVNQRLPGAGDIQFRWMLGNGNILSTQTRGGPAAIKEAFRVLEQYISDNDRTAPAIPFQSLLTDRRKEPDTAKWVTKLYWPVM